MNQVSVLQQDRVRKNTSGKLNQKIDSKTEENISHFSSQGNEVIKHRLQSLNKEWDIERCLEATSGTNVLLGLVLGLTVNKKWFLLSAVSASFLIQHAVQGWCPPLPVFRRLGIRTKEEIDTEREALENSLNDNELSHTKTVD